MKSLLIDLINNIYNNVNFEESLLQITKLIKTGKIDENDIIDAVLNSFVNDKNKVLNNIAVYLYNNQLYDYIIPLFHNSYELNNKHKDTLYNFSLFLSILGEEELACYYFNKLLKEAINTNDKELYKMIKSDSYLRKLYYKMPKGKDKLENLEILYYKSKFDIYGLNCGEIDEKIVEFTLEDLKKKIKNNIKILLSGNHLEEAIQIIKQYEEITNEEDVDIFILKGKIEVIKGDFEEAKNNFINGLLLDSNNCELLYDIAYLYKKIGLVKKSFYFYKKLYYLTSDNIIKKEIEDLFKTYGEDLKFKVLIGSPINQKPEILKEFIESLKRLDKDNLIVNYYFIDDNFNEESSFIIDRFIKDEKGIIYKNLEKDNYICDNITHHWKENLIWKVASFKNKIIKYAQENNYDFLFLIDSDIVLHPNTLKHLIKSGKDIISEIFWTKWQSNIDELPQVWLKDIYTLYEYRRDEKLSENEIQYRQKNFLDMLRRPGIYEVGGLGACTLISKFALDKGVNFSELKNISFWGEDRHFCIRAVALGFRLYVDTYYPAYHIYRESDLLNINNFKNKNKKNIVLVYTNNSGSNTIALSRFIPNEFKEKYNIRLVKQDMGNEYIKAITEADLLCITEANVLIDKSLLNKKQIIIDLWHGFPIKVMGFVDKTDNFTDRINKTWKNIDYICSYSQLFNDLMEKCIGKQETKFVITGSPRNDLLFNKSSKKNLEKILNIGINNNTKICFYLPTFRYSIFKGVNEGNKKLDNVFGFDNFDNDRFIKWSKDNNILFLVKLHPAEEEIIKNKINIPETVKMISNQLLEKHNFDLYDILGVADYVITDYSSVYFDTLLLDKKVLFIPVDIKDYNDKRGFLLNYDEWTPGPKIYDQIALESEFEKFSTDEMYYKNEREIIKNKVHYYYDNSSSYRVWNFIDQLLTK